MKPVKFKDLDPNMELNIDEKDIPIIIAVCRQSFFEWLFSNKEMMIKVRNAINTKLALEELIKKGGQNIKVEIRVDG